MYLLKHNTNIYPEQLHNGKKQQMFTKWQKYNTIMANLA